MLEWRDEGVLLAVRGHGENAAIIEVFTARHGLHAGVVPGGASRKVAPVLQPGADLQVTWRARLDDHIGTYTVEPRRSRTALFDDRRGLLGLNAICAIVRLALPEREPHEALYASTQALLSSIDAGGDWAMGYLWWELLLLREAGYGLDLSACAVTGATDGLVYVSPRTGRAVSRDGAGDWADRLLPLPPCLTDPTADLADDPAGLAEGLRTTGWFIEHRLAAERPQSEPYRPDARHEARTVPRPGPRPMPEARRRLVAALTATTTRRAGRDNNGGAG